MKPLHTVFLWLGLIAVIPAAAPVCAQTGSSRRVAEIRRAMEQAQFQIAAALADSAIAHFREYLPQQLAEIHALRALFFFEQGYSERAEEQLTLALQLDPALHLDPVFFSPQIQRRLEELRPQVANHKNVVAPTVRYIVVSDPRLAAAWRSLLLPGWGQRFKGERMKGRVFSIAAATLAGATITSQVLRERAQQRYREAVEENAIKSRYDTFNRYHLWRNNLALALGVVWGAATLEALIVRVEPPSQRVGLTPMLQITPEMTRLSLAVTF